MGSGRSTFAAKNVAANRAESTQGQRRHFSCYSGFCPNRGMLLGAVEHRTA
jgi:hypothetical protein